MIFFDQLCYVKSSDSDSRDKFALFVDGATLTLKNISFEKLQEILPADQFCRVNKKELIAVRAVQLFSFDEITTNLNDKSGDLIKLTLSEVYRNNFIETLKL